MFSQLQITRAAVLASLLCTLGAQPVHAQYYDPWALQSQLQTQINNLAAQQQLQQQEARTSANMQLLQNSANLLQTEQLLYGR